MTDQSDIAHALEAIAATGEEYVITSTVGDLGERAYVVEIQDIAAMTADPRYAGTHYAGASKRRKSLAYAICEAILLWAETKEDR